MARKQPVLRQKVERTFKTQDKALKWAQEERTKFRQANIRRRFDVVQNLQGGWNVVSFSFIEPVEENK